jgi:tetratricopeptide (TPR) repeat protein
MSTYEEAVSELDVFLESDDTEGLTAYAKQIFNSDRKPEVKGAACVAIARKRLRTELYMNSSTSAAMAPASEALRLFQEARHSVGEANANNVLALANLVIQDLQAALSYAKHAEKLAQNLDDFKLIAEVLDTQYQVHTARGDTARALAAIKQRVATLQKLPDKKALASALTLLSNLQLERGLTEAAAQSADEASSILAAIGDNEGGKLAKQSLSRALAKVGRVDEAPNRSRALACLSHLASAAERKDAASWRTAMADLQETGSYTDKDIKDALTPILESDREGVSKFLSINHVPFKDKKIDKMMHSFTKQNFYARHRLVGLEYGPRFQCVRPWRVDQSDGLHHAVAALQPYDECEAWELHLSYNPGILDGALQSGLVSAVKDPNQIKALEPQLRIMG